MARRLAVALVVVLQVVALGACGRGEDRPGQVTSETKTTSNR